MAARLPSTRPPLITSARAPASLSTDQRTRRYVITMTFRVVCFVAAVVSPPPWNAVLFVAAAVLPGIAVLFGNARDNRAGPVASDAAGSQLALTSGDVVEGEAEADEEEKA